MVYRYEADNYLNIQFKQSKYGPDLPEDEDDFFDWYVEMIDFKSFYIVVEFYYPELVSQTNNHRDQVRVTVKNVESFYSSNNKTATTPFDS